MSDVIVNNPAALGAAVREWRLRSGLTQAELAERAGVSRAWLIRLEDGHPRAELFRVLAIVRALHADVHLRQEELTDRQVEELEHLSRILGEKS